MPVVRESVREQVRRALTERIVTGHYRPGERLVELQIAREFGTSQGPVREALRELEASHLVESEPHRGTRVRTISPREMREAYEVRGVLEAAAVAAGFADVTALRADVAGVLAAAEAGDLAEQAARVYAFHRRVVAAAGNGVLLRMWESLALETRVRVRLGWGPVDPAAVTASYDAILTALERGDAAAAGRLLREHAAAFAVPDDNAVFA